ncbi:Holliday junction branch migration protein RuvA [Aliiruegeria lutimaris]|uniref:Holliday junction branch migration complex subunit RuvA n=1 Tax=Aliiruegeria lutimaris TaxID=571298 RepID=A0A1G8LTS4_9RHOB|nr:Holliday junction branch migration protein RuvA [Aliiruegeria lutimaris]SDI58590.1 Holliday junction DNA helicase subunit RuvA [Aliiruegeria lutimaris]
MIGRLAGRIDYRGPDHVLLDVNGVGYIVYVSERTLMELPATGEFAALYTDLVVREDLLQLYGFPSLQEKEWHRLLTSVQGIGAKASMAILGALGPDGTARAITLGDWSAIRAAPGVGPKLAQRVVNELKDKAPTIMAMAGSLDQVIEPKPINALATAQSGAETRQKPTASPRAAAQSEALSALTNLGYQQGEAAAAVARILTDDPEADTSALIHAALKSLAPKG